LKLVASLLLCISASSLAAAQPSHIAAHYSISYTGITIGRVDESFVRTGNTYSIESITRSEGPLKAFLDDQITAGSTGRVVDMGLQPLSYSEKRLKDGKRDLTSQFDWDKGVMRTSSGGQETETALPTATQDRISMMYQFMNMREFGPTIVVPMATRRKIETYTYRLVDEGKVATPAGEFYARHYQRVTSDPKDTKADVWLAKDRFNFPVRVVLDDPKGFKLDQVLLSMEAK